MKKLMAILFASFFLTQCSEEIKQEKALETVQETEIKLLSEELKPYALTAIDSVYSVSIKLTSTDSALVQYNVTLMQGNDIFQDSLVFNIPAGNEVLGEFIFPACRVKNNPKPSYTSKIKRVNDR